MPTPTVNFNLQPNKQQAHRRVLFRTSDGDTPVIEQPVRAVSCDTPEKAGYAGAPSISQPKLDTCRQRLCGNFYSALPQPLRKYLIQRLTPDAAANHIAGAVSASTFFDTILEQRLTRADGTKRGLAVIATGEIVDRYGRFLAYFAPWFTGSRTDPLPPRNDPARRTFNLQMVESGWAASFPIYPSLPNNSDMNRLIAGAEAAWNERKGVWNVYGRKFLLGHEFRACIKLGTAQTPAAGIKDAFQRVCVDLRTLRNVGKFGFSRVPPPYRLWIWETDVEKATVELGLQPQG
jgi:endonuclease YncB( thermonuclease family)